MREIVKVAVFDRGTKQVRSSHQAGRICLSYGRGGRGINN